MVRFVLGDGDVSDEIRGGVRGRKPIRLFPHSLLFTRGTVRRPATALFLPGGERCGLKVVWFIVFPCQKPLPNGQFQLRYSLEVPT